MASHGPMSQRHSRDSKQKCDTHTHTHTYTHTYQRTPSSEDEMRAITLPFVSLPGGPCDISLCSCVVCWERLSCADVVSCVGSVSRVLVSPCVSCAGVTKNVLTHPHLGLPVTGGAGASGASLMYWCVISCAGMSSHAFGFISCV